jgi:hypothetical protein
MSLQSSTFDDRIEGWEARRVRGAKRILKWQYATDMRVDHDVWSVVVFEF